MIEDNAFVSPGEKIATEEEFAAGSNTYSEEGVIYSSIIGRITKSDGVIGVSVSAREIKIIGKNMLVIGTVTDDMKNVMFVEINNINVERKDYLALKDGKILAPKPRSPRFSSRMGGREGRFSSRIEKAPKPCGIGDTILARVLYNDKDSYTLSLDGNDTGVVFSRCLVCGGEMERNEGSLLSCKECGHKEHKKISEYYNKPEDIMKLFT